MNILKKIFGEYMHPFLLGISPYSLYSVFVGAGIGVLTQGFTLSKQVL
jgi:hypothetical protein